MICCLGDLLLDVIVRLDGPIAEDTDTYGRTRVAAGGQAANVAAWATALGGPARFVGKRARDLAGKLVAQELSGRGVEVAGPEAEAGTGTVVSIATPDGRRSMLSDRGVALAFSVEELEPGWLDGCTWLFVAGYSLVDAPIRETALAAAALVREAGARVCVDLSSTTAIELAGVERFRASVAALRPQTAFANEEEASLFGPIEAPVVVVKRGPHGCVVHETGSETAYPAEPADVVDTTGAGDAFTAGFLLGGAELALAAGARCVATMGAMP